MTPDMKQKLASEIAAWSASELGQQEMAAVAESIRQQDIQARLERAEFLSSDILRRPVMF